MLHILRFTNLNLCQKIYFNNNISHEKTIRNQTQNS